MTHPEFDKSLTYYVAGPMTGIPEYNYPAFEGVCTRLRERGIDIVSPHEVPWPASQLTKDDQEALWEYMMEHTRELLERASGIILLPGWYTSRGVLVELGIVREAKLPTWFHDPRSSTLIPMWIW